MHQILTLALTSLAMVYIMTLQQIKQSCQLHVHRLIQRPPLPFQRAPPRYVQYYFTQSQQSMVCSSIQILDISWDLHHQIFLKLWMCATEHHRRVVQGWQTLVSVAKSRPLRCDLIWGAENTQPV